MAGIKITGPKPIEVARDILEAAGFRVAEARPIAHGVQFKLEAGGGVNVYATGAVLPQGTQAAAVTKVFQAAIAAGIKSPPAPVAKSLAAPVVKTQREAVKAPVEVVEDVRSEAPSRRHPEWTEEPWNGECPF